MSAAQQRPSAAEIRFARRAAGLTQREAAALISLSPRTIADYEQGRYVMRPERWELLSQKLAGVTAEAVLRDRLTAATERWRAELGGRGIRCDVDAASGAGNVRDPAYAEQLRLALELCQPPPTLKQLAGWCGFSSHALRAWLKPQTSRSHRPMPRSALRLALWELSARHHGDTDWRALLLAC